MASVQRPERLKAQPADQGLEQALSRSVSPMTAWSFSIDGQKHVRQWCDTMNRLGFSVIGLPDAEHQGASVQCLTSPLGVEFVLFDAANQSISGGGGLEPRTTWMATLLSGRASLVTDQKVEGMSPGDIAHGSGDQAVAVKLETGCRLLFVRAPQIVTDLQGDAKSDARVSHLAAAGGSVRILSGLLRATGNVLCDLTVQQLRPVELALIEFFTLWTVEREGDDLESRAHLRRLRQAVESQMPDPGLSLRRLADSEGVTPRYVQKLFGAKGETFSGYLRTRRLERCRQDLTSPQHATRSIPDIYSRWGFKGATQFSRAFCKRFGASPRQVRRQARIGL
jgi:AraC-like DNA-binding protein